MILTEEININDHTILIEAVHRILENDSGEYTVFPLGNRTILEEVSYGTKSSTGDFVVLGEDTALELGSPDRISLSRLLWTGEKGLLKNRVSIIGNSLPDYEGRRCSFMQIVMIEPDKDNVPDPAALNRVKNLANLIPGYMTRTIPDKIWIRIHKKLLKKGFTLQAMAEALFHTYTSGEYSIKNIEIILIAGDDEQIKKYIPISDAAKVISSENRKQRWIEDGVISCEDLDCSSCVEKKDCDTIKELVKNRRHGKNE